MRMRKAKDIDNVTEKTGGIRKQTRQHKEELWLSER